MLSAALDAVGDVLSFRAADLPVPGGQREWMVAIQVAIIAGLSTMLGHAVVFVLNSVRGVRFAISMALGAVFLTGLQVISALVTVSVAWVALGGVSVSTVVAGYLYALAPRILGILVFVPHFGLLIGRILEGWILLCQVVVLRGLLELPWAAAIGISGIAWLATQLLSRLLARPVASVASRIWSAATGRAVFLSAHDILAGAPFIPLQPHGSLTGRERS